MGLIHLAGEIGVVLQEPDSQITNLTVLEEVTFALGNLLYPRNELLERGLNSLHMLNINHLRTRSVDTLSGGQLQLLAIASLLALRPKVLLFDEPLAHLDPHGIKIVVKTLEILRKYVDIIIVASHWLDPFMEVATRLLVLDRGRVELDISMDQLKEYSNELDKYHIERPQLYSIEEHVRSQGVQLEFTDGKLVLPPNHCLKPDTSNYRLNNNYSVIFERVSYIYSEGNGLFDISAGFSTRTRYALVGHNGSGKTTLARLLAGLRKPTSGKIESKIRRPALMLQKPSLGFITTSVEQELTHGQNFESGKLTRLLTEFDLERYRYQSPFELSGGEQRRLALALALSCNADLLILDEPTAGLDSLQVNFLKDCLGKYTETLVTITHDYRIIGNYIKKICMLGAGKLLYMGDFCMLGRELVDKLGLIESNLTLRLAVQYLNSQFPTEPKALEVQKCN